MSLSLLGRSGRRIDVMAMTDPLAFEKAMMEDLELVPDVDAFEPDATITYLPPRLYVIQGGAARPFAVASPELGPCA